MSQGRRGMRRGDEGGGEENRNRSSKTERKGERVKEGGGERDSEHMRKKRGD